MNTPTIRPNVTLGFFSYKDCVGDYYSFCFLAPTKAESISLAEEYRKRTEDRKQYGRFN